MKKTNFLTILLLFIFFFFLTGESIQFSADFMRYEAAEGSKFTVLSGNAYVKTGSKEITADEISLYGEDYNILVCSGNVEVNDSEEELKINSETLYYDRESKITRINSRSVMEDYKNEMIIKSGFMDYKQEEDILMLQIGVRILKEDLTCRCEFAIYDKNADSLIMTGLPVVYKNDDIFRASKITVLLENDEIQMDGKVEGSLVIEDEEELKENNETIKEEDSGNNPES
jgi:lipopolysaccharide export system protein LptA